MHRCTYLFRFAHAHHGHDGWTQTQRLSDDPVEQRAVAQRVVISGRRRVASHHAQLLLETRLLNEKDECIVFVC